MSSSTRNFFDLTVLFRGLFTWAACISIALLLVILQPDHHLGEELIYSLAIGTSSWLLCELLMRVLRRADDPAGWPLGTRGILLMALGIVGGFGAGTAIGDALLGHSSWKDGAPLKASMVVTALVTIGLVTTLRNRGRRAELEAAAQEAARTAAEAKLKLLEVQLEPHMLFNTLANLRVLVATDPVRAQQMLDHLIAYLRATLDGSRASLHPLVDEFARLADYLALMQVRMGPRLAFRFDLPHDLQHARVPSLILQPLVENAIRHGLEPQITGGSITVRASVIEAKDSAGEARLQLEVLDDGAGLSDAAVTPGAIGNGANGVPSSGFGTEQVRARLTALYGGSGTIALIAGSAGGTSAIVRFPIKFS